MLRSAVLMRLLLLPIGTGLFAGTATGSFILDGTTYSIGSVLAKTDENPFDKTKRDILVLLTDQPVGEADLVAGHHGRGSLAEHGSGGPGGARSGPGDCAPGCWTGALAGTRGRTLGNRLVGRPDL